MSDPIPLPTKFSTDPYPRTNRSALADTVAGALLWVVLGLAALLAVSASGLYAMAADGCPIDAPCAAAEAAGQAIVAQWAGVAVIVAGAVIGSVVSITKKRYFWHWPLIGIALVVACTLVTMGMANAAMKL